MKLGTSGCQDLTDGTQVPEEVSQGFALPLLDATNLSPLLFLLCVLSNGPQMTSSVTNPWLS